MFCSCSPLCSRFRVLNFSAFFCFGLVCLLLVISFLVIDCAQKFLNNEEALTEIPAIVAPLDDLWSEKSNNQWETYIICLQLRHQYGMSNVSRAQPPPRCFEFFQRTSAKYEGPWDLPPLCAHLLERLLGTRQSRVEDLSAPKNTL